ncbi:MAG TPA: hypothetical protein VNM24_17575 [Burkholderiales bacterium]|nr:hypothetical protein [Burkholderiales bacterium]
MSEYQCYEFQAIDRPLDEREMRMLRQYSTRATITLTRFVNSHVCWSRVHRYRVLLGMVAA